jgi:acyl-CoA synthetase (AMP-forming)/AMP-acid ligase II
LINTSEPGARVNRRELTPLSFLERSALVYPERVAVVHEDRRYTYRELAARVNRLASALRRDGLRKGDRVAFICPNTPALLEAHYGVPAAGGTLVALNYRLTVADVATLLEHSGARFVFADHEFEHLVTGTPGIEVVRIADSGSSDDPYEQFLAEGSPEPLPTVLEDEREPISINYTSGTTGNPKGAIYQHRGAYLNALGEVIETRLTSDSVYLWTLPMFHCNGWCFTWAVTAVGGRHVCLRKVEPDKVWDLLESEGVTHYCGAPTVQASILDHGKAHPLGRDVTTVVSGSPPTREQFARLSELGFRPVHVYGATDLYGPYMVCEPHAEWEELPLAERAALLARQGVNYLVADPVRVVDAAGDDVPADGRTLGEVLMRGNNVMKGYFNDPEQTAETFAGGWYHSGDLAVRHPDGYIELRDRMKDIIISGGENIPTIQVEQAIRAHPAVDAVAVVSMPDEKWGERPKAFVQLAPGKQATEQELLAFASERLPRYMRPDVIEFTELARTATGKVKKQALREREWRGHERKIA